MRKAVLYDIWDDNYDKQCFRLFGHEWCPGADYYQINGGLKEMFMALMKMKRIDLEDYIYRIKGAVRYDREAIYSLLRNNWIFDQYWD